MARDTAQELLINGQRQMPLQTVESTDTQDSDATIENPEVSCIPVDSGSNVVTITLGEELAYDEHVVKVVDVGMNAGTNGIEITASVGDISGNVGVSLVSNATAAEFVFLDPPSEWFITNTFNPVDTDAGDGGLIGGLL